LLHVVFFPDAQTRSSLPEHCLVLPLTTASDARHQPPLHSWALTRSVVKMCDCCQEPSSHWLEPMQLFHGTPA
jgi:hypothetical protein